MSRRSMSLGWKLLVSFALVSGCSAPGEGDGERVGDTGQAILGGSADPGDTNVVDIVWESSTSGVQQCTGSLIAPNLVLTAHHCVSEVSNKASGADCATSQFAAPDAVGNLSVTTRAQVSSDPADFHAVREVVVPPGSTTTSFCGFDLALLVLSDDVQPSEAVPLVPLVDGEVAPQEVYAAVGFGLTGDGTGESGTRRRLGGLLVDCVGQGCASSAAAAAGQVDTQHEWIGDHGTCQGDSGGPALDAANRVIGVISRSASGCTAPIYGDVHSWADWIKETAQHAASVGNYAAPAWAAGSEPASGKSGCSVGWSEPAGQGTWWLGAAVGAVASRRRRAAHTRAVTAGPRPPPSETRSPGSPR